jgi:DNA/RNA endonuclease YhcR with UshA esterase domain
MKVVMQLFFFLIGPFAYFASMKSILLFFCLLAGIGVSAQKAVALDKAGEHVGDSVVVTGKVFGMRHFADGRQAPTLLNLGAAFPNQLLTVVFYGETRQQFFPEAEKTFEGQWVRVAGKVELYRGRPQIVVRSGEQLTTTAPPAESK